MNFPVQISDNKVYFFGVRVISQGEQYKLIVDSGMPCETISDVHHVRKCVVKKCAEIIHPLSRYYCAIHLARNICRARENCDGAKIQIEFPDRSDGVNKYSGKLSITFNVRDNQISYYLNGVPVKGSFNVTDSNDYVCKFVVEDEYKVSAEGKSYRPLVGTFSGYLIGRYACKNIVTKNICYSLQRGETSNALNDSILLPGMCDWTESTKRGTPTVDIYEYCSHCFQNMNVDLGNNPGDKIEKENSALRRENRKLLNEVIYLKKKLVEVETKLLSYQYNKSLSLGKI